MEVFNLDSLFIWFKPNLVHITVIRVIAQYVNVWVFRALSLSFELSIMYVALKHLFNFPRYQLSDPVYCTTARKGQQGNGDKWQVGGVDTAETNWILVL